MAREIPWESEYGQSLDDILNNARNVKDDGMGSGNGGGNGSGATGDERVREISDFSKSSFTGPDDEGLEI